MPTDSARRLVVAALVCTLVAVAVAPGLGGAAVDVEEIAEGSDVLPQQATPTNETVRHEDPDSVDRQGDLAALERHLAGQLSERLGESTVSISQGEYERARSVVGDEYDGLLARYVDVAGETEGEGDDEAAESFREAGEGVRTFADRTAQFNETYREYEQANEQGEEARARELARQLVGQSRDVARTNRRLQGDLDAIENGTGQDLSTEQGRVRTVTDSIQARADQVADATFVRTRIEAGASPTAVSFLRPTTVRGRLVDENGTALADRPIRIGNGSDAVVVRTDGSGAFEATYRPVRLPTDAAGVSVSYVPENASAYLGNRTTATVSVTPVTPAVTAEASPDAAAFGNDVGVTGTVTAEDVPVPGVPVVASIAGVTIGRGVTDDDGTYAVSGALPADVPDGDRDVVVRIDQQDRAVASASASSPLGVEPTRTTLSLDATLGANETVIISGQLQTVDGVGVGEQSIRLGLGGTSVETVTTDPDGEFATQIPPSEWSADGDGNVTVLARFDGSGTNLEGSRSEVVLAVPGTGGSGSAAGLPLWQWLAVAVAVGLVVVGGLVAWRRWEPDGGDGTADAAAASTRASDAGERDGSGGSPVDPGWREAVTDLLGRGETDLAVAVAYGAARNQLSGELEASDALTPWEFYAAASRDGVDAERVAALQSLTAAHEQARFAPASVSAADAEAAVDSAGHAIGR